MRKLIGERRSRTQIKLLIVNIEQQVNSASLCNRRLYELLPEEEEHAAVNKWFEDVAQKADDAVSNAYTHLE